MKLLLQLFILLLSISAFADGGGDGTLPVIKSINVKFINGSLVTLPKDITIKVDIALKLMESVTKELEVLAINLEQKITLKNIDGALDIKVKSNKLINTEIPFQQMQKQIRSNELYNEVDLLSGLISQQVTVTYLK